MEAILQHHFYRFLEVPHVFRHSQLPFMVQWSVVGAVSSECQRQTEQVTPDFTGGNNLGLPTQQLLEAG